MDTLRRLTIHRFRRVVPETTLELADGFNVVLGRNATGKTTLLSLAMAADGFDFSAFRDEPFDVSWEREGSEGRSRTRVVNHVEVVGAEKTRNTYSTVDMAVEPSSAAPYRVVLGRDTADLLLDDVVASSKSRSRSMSMGLESIIVADRVLSVDATLAHPDFHEPAVRLDESTKYLDDVLRATVELIEGGQGARSTTTMPRDILHGFLEPASTDDSPSKSFVSAATPFLADVASTLGFTAGTLTFELRERREGTRLYDNLRFLFTDENQDLIRHDILSYGQKRMLSALWYFASNPGLLACDELVNGLHHEWISTALDRIKSRQALLTSQSPLLLDYLRFESAEQVRRSFISCERRDGQLVWRNFTAAEAADFFAAYEIGIQRISDILVTRGLW